MGFALFPAVPHTSSLFARLCKKIDWFSNRAVLSHLNELLIVKFLSYLSGLWIVFPSPPETRSQGHGSLGTTCFPKGLMYSKHFAVFARLNKVLSLAATCLSVYLVSNRILVCQMIAVWLQYMRYCFALCITKPKAWLAELIMKWIWVAYDRFSAIWTPWHL